MDYGTIIQKIQNDEIYNFYFIEDDELESSTTYNQSSTNSDSFVKYNSKV